jgi:hypothetical protein
VAGLRSKRRLTAQGRNTMVSSNLNASMTQIGCDWGAVLVSLNSEAYWLEPNSG